MRRKVDFIVVIKGHIIKTEYFGFLKWDVPLIDVLINIVPESVSCVRKSLEKFDAREVVHGGVDSFIKVLEVWDLVHVARPKHLVLQPSVNFGLILLTISFVRTSVNFQNDIGSFLFVDLRLSIAI